MHKSGHHLSLSPVSPPSTLSFLIPGTRGRGGYSGAFIDSSQCKFPLFPLAGLCQQLSHHGPRVSERRGRWAQRELAQPHMGLLPVSVHGFYSTFLACPVLIWLLLFFVLLCGRLQLLEKKVPPLASCRKV